MNADTLKLPPMPARIAKLPKNARGYPVPYFVAWIDGLPDFRLVRPETAREARVRKLCWICGEPLGAQQTFAIGPMCVVNRNSGEPPSHRQCAEFAVKACPFMLKPNMERREDDLTRECKNNVPGIAIPRNPGVMCLWTSANGKPVPDGRERYLWNIGDHKHVSWWREGRPATYAEIHASIMSGIPLLREVDGNDPKANAEIDRLAGRALILAQTTC